MIRMTVGELAEATKASLLAGDPQASFEGLHIDSRQVPAGGAFVAFAGERVDGNRFAAQALRDGAAVVVLTAEPAADVLEAARETGSAVVRAEADDGEEFMLRLAGAWRERNPQWCVVGVTGSVGKTTTKEMLAAGIGACKRVHATKGNFNNLLGVPLTLFAAPEDAEVLVVEMGMNNPGELSRIVAAARPCVATITNVGTSHIGNLGSREGIARAKAEVVAGLEAAHGVGPALVLTASDDYTSFIEKTFCEPAGVPVVRVGSQGSSVWARDLTLDEEGLPSFALVGADKSELAVKLSLPGRAMVADLLSAVGVIRTLGLPVDAAVAAIERMEATHMRLEVRQEGESPRVIDDSYNASPSSMAAALDVLCSMKCAGRRVAVLGEIGELGEESARLHSLVGAYAAAKPLDLLVLVGEEGARLMADAACTMGFSEDHIERFANAAEAARVMAPIFEKDDLVLVKASRAVGLDLFAREVLAS
ncbi:MAG: UDP-N-acetylmuramoyl-tripeptide--D-alanyl-D-alanine ligase [Coriobacteriales bacterium]|nr:UDP-N-acetylmuramoyl-tripeptide--D-alanyl-D-alanine ligase [Coriobacteriales bacterium]